METPGLEHTHTWGERTVVSVQKAPYELAVVDTILIVDRAKNFVVIMKDGKIYENTIK